MAGTYALVREAIEGRRQVHATFDGHRRRLCPHVIGTRNGEPRALFFQFGGASSRGLLPGGDWRCLPLDGLSDVSVHDGVWHTRAHSEPQRCIDDVDLEIEA
ncbi:MAG TPA: hypothetical protein VFI03_02565 [Solirubrobacterales bacterium]|nr:hypothetical protein [Solirubrobacterales bacterium]